MVSPYCFIAEPLGGVRYDSVTKSGLVVSASKEDHRTTNRNAVVKSVPLNYEGPIESGDTLLVHHNTFRKYYDMKGKERSGPSYFKDNLFFIFDDQYFMYKKSDGKWKAPAPYCFVKPAGDPLMGTIVYGNEELEALGIMEGDLISFQPDSEYEFKIEDEVLYRMFTRNICLTKI
jgi:hypothetical protein